MCGRKLLNQDPSEVGTRQELNLKTMVLRKRMEGKVEMERGVKRRITVITE